MDDLQPSTPGVSRSKMFRWALIFALVCAVALGTLCLTLPLPSGTPEAGKSAPTFLLFLGRFHPILLHFPVALLVFTAILRVISLLPPGRSLAPFVGYCLWFAAGSALITAGAGWLLAQEGGYNGPIFDLHWRCGLGIVLLALTLLVLHYSQFPGLAAAQGLCWVSTLGVMTFGAHQGGALTHGEGFFTELAPSWLQPLIGEGKHSKSDGAAAGAHGDPGFAATTAMFDKFCTECHGASKNKGEQRLHTPKDIAKGGRSGASVVPGKPDESLVLARILLPAKDRKHMPPDGKPQPAAEEIDTLRQWIAGGAAGLPGTTASGEKVASNDTPSSDTNTRSDQQSGDRNSTSGAGLRAQPKDPTEETMKIRPVAATTAVVLAGALTATAQNPNVDALGADVLKVFKARCAECHGKAAERPAEFSFIDDLPALLKSELVDLANPQASKIYTMVQTAEMPLRTKADKEAGKKKADPLTENEISLVLSWLNAQKPGAAPVIATNTPPPLPPTPTDTTGTVPVTNFSKPPVLLVALRPAEEGTTLANAFPEYTKVTRKLVTPQEEVVAAVSDLQTVAREEQADTRYVSLAAPHNNAMVSKDQLENMRRGARKMLNSLSTGPSVVNFPEVGPEKVLIRVRLRDIGWTPAIWESVASHFPLAIDTGVSAALGSASRTAVPIIRADWMAANATRPPLYHDILRIPKTQQEIEKDLGIDLFANLRAGEATRAALVKSGISLANRLIERHETRSRGGYYWASYDFKSSGGKANLLDNPLGPEEANLAGGKRAFNHVGGEFVFTLPNGFHGYFLADHKGHRLDGAAPTDIVGDRRNITGRVEITNGLSCIICHNDGIKPTETSDSVRALASKFSAEEQKLIERLHPPEAKLQGILTADTDRFRSALKSANAEQVQGQPESVGALAGAYDREVSLETAAAEIGLSPEALGRLLESQNALFSLERAFQNGGTLLREHFLDYFPDLVQRLDIGTVRRGATPIAAVPLPGRTENLRPIALELKTDKTTYKEGDDIVITVKAAEAGHLRILYQNAAGEIVTLFPNQFIDNDKIEGGKEIKIVPTPNPKKAGDDVAIVVTGPHFGTEFLAAIVTDQPFTDEKALHDQFKNTQFAKSASRTIEGALGKSAQAISRPAREGQSGGARAGFARVTLTTIKK